MVRYRPLLTGGLAFALSYIGPLQLQLQLQLQLVEGAGQFNWIEDNVTFTLNLTASSHHGLDVYSLEYSAARQVLPPLPLYTDDDDDDGDTISDSRGHFRISMTYVGGFGTLFNVSVNTSCIPFGASADVIESAIISALHAGGSSLHDDGSDVTVVNIKRDGDVRGTLPCLYSYEISVNVSSVLNDGLQLTGVTVGSHNDSNGYSGYDGCQEVMTYGLWNDAANWLQGSVPGAADSVTIPADSGYIAVTSDTTVTQLTQLGGAIVLGSTGCLSGWLPAPALPTGGGSSDALTSTTTKCYKLFEKALPWDDAAKACRAYSAGAEHNERLTSISISTSTSTSTAHRRSSGGENRFSRRPSTATLVAVESLEEGRWVGRLARADALERNVWIGAKRIARTTDTTTSSVLRNVDYDSWLWDGQDGLRGDVRYRAWARGEPDKLEPQASVVAVAVSVAGATSVATAVGAVDRREACASIISGRRVLAAQAEPQWDDVDCLVVLPYICQHTAPTTGASLTITNLLEIDGGFFSGRGYVISEGQSLFNGTSGLLNSVTWLNRETGSVMWFAEEARGWGGGQLQNMGTISFLSAQTGSGGGGGGGDAVRLPVAKDDKGFAVRGAGAWPVIHNLAGGILEVADDVTVDMTWLLWNEGGSVVVNSNSNLTLQDGGTGYSRAGGVIKIDRSGVFEVRNGSFGMSQWQVLALTIESDRYVSGEEVEDEGGWFRGVGGTAGGQLGHYRLTFAGEQSDCIPYNASASTLQAVLEGMSSVADVGGVEVSCSSGLQTADWRFGARYRITFDGQAGEPDTLSSSGGGSVAPLSFLCSGSVGSCGCADVVGSIDVGSEDATRGGGGRGGGDDDEWYIGTTTFVNDIKNGKSGSYDRGRNGGMISRGITSTPLVRRGCGGGKRSSVYNSNKCLVVTSVSIESVHDVSSSAVTGAGVLRFSSGGSYSLPSRVDLTLDISSSAEVVCAHSNCTLAADVTISDGGVLWMVGSDLSAWDAVNLLFADPDTPHRSALAMQAVSLPNFNSTIEGELKLSGGGQMRLFGDRSYASSLKVTKLIMDSGCVGGTAVVVVADGEAFVVQQGANFLRYGVRVRVDPGGTMLWAGGDIFAVEGAAVNIRHHFNITTSANGTFGSWQNRASSGNSGVMSDVGDDVSISSDDGGDEDADGSRDGDGGGAVSQPLITLANVMQWDGAVWYSNPLCFGQCNAPARLYIARTGVVTAVGAGGNVTARLCADITLVGTIVVGELAFLEACGGGSSTESGIIQFLTDQNPVAGSSSGGGGGGGGGGDRTNGTVCFSSGSFEFDQSALVEGEGGVIEFSGGMHYLPDVVEPLVRISGQATVFYTGVTLNMTQGLHIKESGALRFSAARADVTVARLLWIEGGELSFQRLAHAQTISPQQAQSFDSTLYDVSDWDDVTGERSTLSVSTGGIFDWDGGIMSGYAHVISRGIMTWNGGDKEASYELHLVNMGTAVWVRGDVHLLAGAYYDNRGTMRLSNNPGGGQFNARMLRRQKEGVAIGRTVAWDWSYA